jgi:hypothetical protein
VTVQPGAPATATPTPSPARNRRRRNDAVVWSMAAAVFWAATGYLGLIMFNARPRIAAFDLDLLVGAGRAIDAGRSPYDPAMLAGTVPDAVDLFYSYPPIVGQVLVPVSGLPLGVIAIAWSVLAIALLAVAVVRIGALVAPSVAPGTVAAATVAVAAMTFPLLIAILFGNLDAFFPALYGFVLIGALSGVRRDGIVAGVAIAIGALTKVYPAGLGLWFLVRAVRARRDALERRRLVVPLVAAAVTAAGLVAVSVVAFGPAPWQDYTKVASTAAQAGLVDGRNGAPAAQVALWLGSDSGLARLLHVPVVALAALAIVAAAWFRDDMIESLAIAATASLFLLPVSWIHYPAAMLPFVAAAMMRIQGGDPRAVRRVRTFAAVALLAGALSVAWLPSLWIGLGLALWAVHQSVPAPPRSPPRPAPTLALAPFR